MVGIRDCSEQIVAALVGAEAFRAGSLYRQQKRVVDVALANAGTVVHAKVYGSERQPFAQNIAIKTDAIGRLVIEGECTCSVGKNCKHVAAALLVARDRASELIRAEKRGRVPAPPPVPPSVAALMPAARNASPPPALAAPAPPMLTLSPQLQAWIDALDKADVTSSPDYDPEVKHRVVYVLKGTPQSASYGTLQVEPMYARLRKDGTFGQDARSMNLSTIMKSQARYIKESDVSLASRINLLPNVLTYQTSQSLDSLAGGLLLKDLLASGRCYWLNVNGPRLVLGESRAGRLDWGLDDGGLLRPKIVLDEAAEGIVMLRATPPVWVDPKAGLIGPIDLGLTPSLASAALAVPALQVADARLLTEALHRKSPKLARLAPPIPEPTEIITEPPRPILRLIPARLPVFGAVQARQSYYWTEMPVETVGVGRLSFGYGSAEVALDDARAAPTFAPAGRLVQVMRDPKAEHAITQSLLRLGFGQVGVMRPGAVKTHVLDFLPQEGESAWLDFFWHEAPDLRREGWTILVAADFPVRIAVPDSDIEAEVREGSGIDWLDLHLGVMLDGVKLDLVPALVGLILSADFEAVMAGLDNLEEGDPLYLRLADGRLLGLPGARLKPILAALAELLLTRGETKLRLRPEDAAGLVALEEAGLVFRGGENLRALGRQLRDAGGIPDVALPDSFKAILRPYQARGVAWLQILSSAGLGGILADDMGLGKTVQTLAHIAIEKAEGRLDKPVLVVAPTSLVANWTREAARFAPDLKVLVLHGLHRHKDFGAIAASDLVVTTYPLLARDTETLEAQRWHMVILDEAQTIKNPDAGMTKAVNRLTARQRLCLTGTPLENHLGELWSLFTFVSPGFLGDRKQFSAAYRGPIEKKGDKGRSRLLARRVAPFMLRRTKEAVAGDLPAKTEINEPIDLGTEQRDLYETIRIAMHDKVRKAIAAKGLAQSQIVILDALLKLRQVCCDPRLVKAAKKSAPTAGSAKLDRLSTMIEELLSEGRRILVFSQFTSMLALIEERLRQADIGYSLLTGETRDRPAAIAAFQDGHVPLFLVSLKAGGVGLNLTAADTVILYDPWWNPAVEDQAIDRVHRIGQTKPVFVHRLVATDTIEEKMEILKERKRNIADSLFDAEGVPTLAMTQSDIEVLLG